MTSVCSHFSAISSLLLVEGYLDVEERRDDIGGMGMWKSPSRASAPPRKAAKCLGAFRAAGLALSPVLGEPGEPFLCLFYSLFVCLGPGGPGSGLTSFSNAASLQAEETAAAILLQTMKYHLWKICLNSNYKKLRDVQDDTGFGSVVTEKLS